MLDGDRIATLIAGYLQQQLAAAGLSDKLRLGLVQTAYANGAAAAFLVSGAVEAFAVQPSAAPARSRLRSLGAKIERSQTLSGVRCAR